MDKVAILIPCYNEEATIKSVIEDWRREFGEAKIYVYDNNSTDDTARIAWEMGATVRNEPMQGKGNVVRRMFREIDALCYILVDGDNTYPARYGRIMAQKILSGEADMVVGDRLSSTYFKENKRRFHGFGNTLVRGMVNKIFSSDIKDIMSGYRAMSREFVKTCPVLSSGFEVETEMTMHALDKSFVIESIKINYKDRPEGSVSKLNTYSDGTKVIMTIFTLLKNYRPFKFFGLMALILAIISIMLFVPVLREFLATGLVPRFPTLIVSGLLGVLSLLSFFGGIILQTLSDIEKRQFLITRNSYIK